MWQELKPKLESPSGVLVENEKGINDRYKIVTSPRDIYTIYPNIVTKLNSQVADWNFPYEPLLQDQGQSGYDTMEGRMEGRNCKEGAAYCDDEQGRKKE